MPPNPSNRRKINNTNNKSRLRKRSLHSYIPNYLRSFVNPYQGDFCYSPHFHPAIIAHLMMEGFLPIATPDLCLPKLHEQRCLVFPLSDLHVSRSVRKKCKRFTITLNQCLDRVVAGCRQQHGPSCWLYPKLVQAFESIHRASNGFPTKLEDQRTIPVRIISVEVWNNDTDELVAGEVGYTVGSMYTSLTGFSAQDSAGSVQLLTLGRLLQESGFQLWDLGMEMDYKKSLGCSLLPREQFVEQVHELRTEDRTLELGAKLNCKEIVDGTQRDLGARKPRADVATEPPKPKRAKGDALDNAPTSALESTGNVKNG